ncbi:IscS subfamily cysteine desulfurase [Castellaniella caeni]|uniref:IscS subfamily cysteine desulfurase n=1 Tax=Castellaniella caeni TaxID=266123 RepID=UPI000C9EDC83|nr:IscS subfamily cysteine desulfurase [Castellaniella caeni]
MLHDLPPDHPIYLDYSATTPVDERVVEAMVPWLRQRFGNPASRSHAWGWDAEEAVEQARVQVAGLIHADPREIIFTSGATESDNLALKGVAEFHAARGRHIVTVRTEHKAVLDACQALEQQGFQVTYLDVDADGLLSAQALADALRPDTILVSVMLVNNEIGVVQDIAALAAVCRERGILFHTDAAQATGKVAIDVQALDVDLMSLSAHKTYGPKGIGALYVRRKPRVRLEAQIHGGGHERGMRSGTLPTHQIVGMGQAYALAAQEMADEVPRIRALRDRLWAGLRDLPDIYLNGHPEQRVAHTLNFSVAHIEGEALLMSIPELAVSTGSACTSASLEPSYVLRALGRSDPLAHSSLRLTLGRYTTQDEVDRAVVLLRTQIQRLRELSPLWEMRQQGTLSAWAEAH